MIITELKELISLCDALKKDWKKIAWTNGCFDIIHPWHIETFRFAKERSDFVIVWVNGDNSPYFKSKPGRPINNEDFRTRMLDAIQYVDAVYVFNDETPFIPISQILPNLLIKWGDYRAEDIVWYSQVTLSGWLVKIVPTVWNYSTSSIIKKVLSTYSN